MDFITAKQVYTKEGFKSLRERIFSLSFRLKIPWTGKVSGPAVKARVDFGRWIADCPGCNGSEYVDPDDPVFYCLSCGMSFNQGDAVPVLFPDEEQVKQIESALLEREVDLIPGMDPQDPRSAFSARPKIHGLSRSWTPGETVKTLRDQTRISTKKTKVKKGA